MTTTTQEAAMAEIPPSGGWIAFLVMTIGVLAKGIWPYVTQRTSVRDRLEEGAVQAQREEERDLVMTLKGRVDELTAEVRELRVEVRTLRDAGAAQLATIARLEAQLAASQEEIERLRASRDHYRQLAQAGQALAARSGIDGAQILADEISEADDAQSEGHGGA